MRYTTFPAIIFVLTAVGHSAEPIDIGSRLELFVDDYLIEMGPVAAPLAAASAEIRAQVGSELRDTLKDHARADGVFLASSSWIITARKG